MNKRKLILPIPAAMFLTSLLVAGSALAAPSSSIKEVTFQYQKSYTSHPGQVWTDMDGWHIRNRVDFG
jgi:hypothetical protein